MSNHDQATSLSLNYLSAIENHLEISWDSQSQPVCVFDRINEASIKNLRDDLGDILSGSSSDTARVATEQYGKEHIQTVGFGLASNFDQFVKLGFLYGDRTVLWDMIGSRILKEGYPTPRLKSLLGQTACNLLLLRPIVERGGLVVLPHPLAWSSLAEKVDAELREQGNESTATLGLSMALAAIEEGLPLHPYTLLRPGPQPRGGQQFSANEGDLYSPENYIFHSAITSLLRDQRVAYLQGISASDFYQVVSEHSELQRALRKHFTSDLKGLSPQQRLLELDHLTDDLVKLIEKRNNAIFEYVVDGSEASAALALTSITTLAGIAPLDALAMGGIALPLFGAVRKWIATPQKNVIVQAFQELKNQEIVEQPTRMHSATPTLNDDVDSDACIREIYHQFMWCDWTEERHELLKSLSEDVARKLLRMLNSDDLEVIVNYRTFQEAYIGDYLIELLDLDRDSFWQHTGKTFESPEGMIVSDINDHIEIMCSDDMPSQVFEAMLRSLLNAYRSELEAKKTDYSLDMLLEIVRFQTEGANSKLEKREMLSIWYASLTEKDKNLVRWFLELVYKGSLPVWL